MRTSPRTTNVFLAVLFLGLFAMAARNVTDPDVWWHLKTGQFIAEHKAVPHTDPFSYTRAGEPWVAHEWLSELLLYQLHRTTGWSGLIALFAAIVSATFFLLYLRCGPAPYVAGVATLAGAWATAPLKFKSLSNALQGRNSAHRRIRVDRTMATFNVISSSPGPTPARSPFKRYYRA